MIIKQNNDLSLKRKQKKGLMINWKKKFIWEGNLTPVGKSNREVPMHTSPAKKTRKMFPIVHC